MWRLERNPRIYLAGKISKNDWRGVRGDVGDYNADEIGTDWPVIPGGVFGTFDYVGPYFVGCDHGCGHGPATHGYSDQGCIQWETHNPRAMAREACLKAIQACDVFYAWIDDLTAYGTLVEIGYAEALGKIIVIDGPYAHMSAGEGNEMWFAALASQSHVEYCQRYGSEPGESVRNFCEFWNAYNPRLESEIEYLFWKAYNEWGQPWCLKPGLPVVGADGKNYRLDFAQEEFKLAIELDGHEWHSGKDVFVKDRQRQRALTACGWTFLRFAGREVMNRPEKCVEEVIDYLSKAQAAAGTT